MRLPGWINTNPALPWAAVFLALALMVTQYGGINAQSRLAALRAITEGGTLNIDNYKDWTIDWSLSPNGHYYSNKAPGPVFLALPFFMVTEIFSRHRGGDRLDMKGRMAAPGYYPHLVIVLFTQLLPLTLLVLWIAHWMATNSYSRQSIHFFSLAAFFGSTAAIYMNSNFGHGLAAILFLAAFFSWLRARWAAVGLFLSWSLLSDYGVAFTLPFILLATLYRERNLKPLWLIAAGATPGAVIWIWYHTTAFGSPFATANQFINPEQVAPLDLGRVQLLGGYSPLPSIEVIGELLFGSSRGLLFLQPWVLAAFVLPFLRKEQALRGLAVLATGSLCGMLWMNAGFGGWHGGWTLGPRYIAAVLPAIGLAIALSWDRFPELARKLLWVGLAVALVFRIFVYPFPNLAPNVNLWSYHYGLLFEGKIGTSFLRYALALLAIGLGVFWLKKRRVRGMG